MIEIAIAACFIAVGLIKAYPAIVVLQPGQLARLYRLEAQRADLTVLLRHRGLMLGLIGGFLIAAALVPTWRYPAAAIGLASMIGFVALLGSSSDRALRRIASIDLVATAILCIAVALEATR